MPQTFDACATNIEILVAFGQQLRAIYFENEKHFLLYVGFHGSNSPENSYFALAMHAPQTVNIWLRSINNKVHVLVSRVSLEGFS